MTITQTPQEKKILSSLKHYKDEPISTTELQFITGISFYGVRQALEELEVQDKVIRSVKGIFSYWRLQTKGESVK
jgi:predicted transcriptional regulator